MNTKNTNLQPLEINNYAKKSELLNSGLVEETRYLLES